MFSINRPMAQRIDQLERLVDKLDLKLHSQFDKVTILMQKDNDREMSDQGVDSAQWERIYGIERVLYGTELPKGHN